MEEANYMMKYATRFMISWFVIIKIEKKNTNVPCTHIYWVKEC